jgi:hypothetical protein
MAAWAPGSLWEQSLRDIEEGRKPDAVAKWRRIADSTAEPRYRLQAWMFLRQHAVTPPEAVAKQVLGVVIEVRVPGGLDLVAAYSDHCARYYNFSGSGVVWERADARLDALIDRLLAVSSVLVSMIGPWEGERPGALANGQVRLNFLTPSGLHYGEDPHEALAADPMGGSVLAVATELMIALTKITRGGVWPAIARTPSSGIQKWSLSGQAAHTTNRREP